MRICRLGEKRIRQGWMCVILTLVMLIAPFTASALPWQKNDEPFVKGYQISATSGQVPVEVRIEITAASAKQMRVETAQGTVLLGAESFSYDGNGDSVFVLQTTFSSAYEGELYIYLKNQDGEWIKADAEFYVSYQEKAMPTPVPTPTPIPTPIPKPTSTPKPTPKPTATPVNQTEFEGMRLKLGKDGGWIVSGYTGNQSIIVVPFMVEGKPITAIGERAFYKYRNLVKIILSNGLISIGDEAFSECDHLQDIELPESIETIGKKSFYKCPELREIILPASLTSIGNNAFLRAEEIYTASWWYNREVPIEFYVIRDSYAANYVKAYHADDVIRYYKHSANSSAIQTENFAKYGAKLKSAKVGWVERDDLEAGISFDKATFLEYKQVTTQAELCKKTHKYRLICMMKLTYSKTTANEKMDVLWVLRSPGGRVDCDWDTFQMKKGWDNTWHSVRVDRMLEKNHVTGWPPVPGDYSVELYLDGQFAGEASFTIKE